MENGIPRIEFQLDENQDPHVRARPPRRRFHCPFNGCGEFFHRYSHFVRHRENHECSECGEPYEDLFHVCARFLNNVQQGGAEQPQAEQIQNGFRTGTFRLKQSAHRGTVKIFSHDYPTNTLMMEQAYEDVFDDLVDLLSQMVRDSRGLRVSISLLSVLERNSDNFVIERYFISPFETYTHPSFVKRNILSSLQYLLSSLSLYQSIGSKWTLIRIRTR
jgi:hypothetical protein